MDINFESIMLSGINEKKFHNFIYIWIIKNRKINEEAIKHKHIGTEKRVVVTRGKVWRRKKRVKGASCTVTKGH